MLHPDLQKEVGRLSQPEKQTCYISTHLGHQEKQLAAAIPNLEMPPKSAPAVHAEENPDETTEADPPEDHGDRDIIEAEDVSLTIILNFLSANTHAFIA